VTRNEKLEERILGAEGEYPMLRRAMDGLLEQYAISLGLAVKYVGGQFQFRDHRGQPGAREPLQPVPAARQREALDFLSQRAFAVDAFQISPRLLNRLAPDRWLHWGVGDNFGVFTGPRLDYNLGDKVLAIQSAAMTGLLSPGLLARLREAESRTPDALRMSELFDRTTRMLWGEVAGGSAAAMKALDGPTTRRDLQRAYGPVPSTGGVRSPVFPTIAPWRASSSSTAAVRALAAGPMGDYTRAHLIETRACVKRALEATRQADAAGTGRRVQALADGSQPQAGQVRSRSPDEARPQRGVPWDKGGSMKSIAARRSRREFLSLSVMGLVCCRRPRPSPRMELRYWPCLPRLTARGRPPPPPLPPAWSGSSSGPPTATDRTGAARQRTDS
jgi:hypothetical protein